MSIREEIIKVRCDIDCVKDRIKFLNMTSGNHDDITKAFDKLRHLRKDLCNLEMEIGK